MTPSEHSPARNDEAVTQPTTSEDFTTKRESTPSNAIDELIDSLDIQFKDNGVMVTPGKPSTGSSRLFNDVASATSHDVWEPTLSIDSTPTGADRNLDLDLTSLSGDEGTTSHNAGDVGNMTSAPTNNDEKVTSILSEENLTSPSDDNLTLIPSSESVTSVSGDNENVTSVSDDNENLTSPAGRTDGVVTSHGRRRNVDKDNVTPKRLHHVLTNLPFL